MTDDQAREAALEAADRLFYERGIRPVRMEDVRDASGVSLKRLYKLFPTKDRLADEALRRRESAFLAQLREYVELQATPTERVLALFDYLADWFGDVDFRGCAFINAFGEMSSTSPRVADAVQSQKRSLRSLIASLVQSAGGTEALADQLTMLFNGATVSAAILGDRTAAARAQDAARRLIQEDVGAIDAGAPG